MVARTIHNLKVAGLNLEGGNIFSERYLVKNVCGERKKDEKCGRIAKEERIWEKANIFEIHF